RADFGLRAFPRAAGHRRIVAKLLRCIFSIVECPKILRSARCARTTLAGGKKCGAGGFLPGTDSGGGRVRSFAEKLRATIACQAPTSIASGYALVRAGIAES